MTPGSESQDLEAARQTTIISTRTTTTIAAWNVRTMFEKGKTAQVAAEMRNKNSPCWVSASQDGPVQDREG